MPRVAVVQMETGSCRPPRVPRGVDLVVYPASPCPLYPGEGRAYIVARGDHVLVFEAGRLYSAPCGSAVDAAGLRLLVLCSVEPCVECRGAYDAVIVAEPRWAPLGGARAEARRLAYLLMTLSYRCSAPVLYANLWGRLGSRVYIGASGFYDYSASLPAALGGWGDGVVTREL